MKPRQHREPFAGLQQIVRWAGQWQCAQHMVLQLPTRAGGIGFLIEFLKHHGPTLAGSEHKRLQISLGLTRPGLKALDVPEHVLACLAYKAPAFTAGAAMRAPGHLGATGASPPAGEGDPFEFTFADAVVTVHAADQASLNSRVAAICKLATQHGLKFRLLPLACRLPRPPDVKPSPDDGKAQWAHFGFRDGLARVAVREWAKDTGSTNDKPQADHAVGEFVLGYEQDCGANPWITGPDKRVWPQPLRDFFRDGSFGVLHQIQQDVNRFESFVQLQASTLRASRADIKAKLCGRTPEGIPLAAKPGAKPDDDFDYLDDKKGYACPFGSHIRRMNPRTDKLAHQGRTRAVLRRGMPYGPAWTQPEIPERDRGLMGHFFCASIEDQFEHLVGQWADRVPMGSADPGTARDPLIGAHDPRDGAFVIPMKNQSDLRLTGLQRFTQPRGTAYLFYPSFYTLKRISKSSSWTEPDEDEA